MFELITRTPLFPGDTEGMQLLEHACVLGTPTDEEMLKLKNVIDAKIYPILHNISQFPRPDMIRIITSGPKNGGGYSQ